MPDKRTKALAKTMRRRMTKYEYRLYAGFLSSLPLTVCRQKIIGNYIVDFLIPSAKLIIEVDGSQHYTEKGMEQDLTRDLYLQAALKKAVRNVRAAFSQYIIIQATAESGV